MDDKSFQSDNQNPTSGELTGTQMSEKQFAFFLLQVLVSATNLTPRIQETKSLPVLSATRLSLGQIT